MPSLLSERRAELCHEGSKETDHREKTSASYLSLGYCPAPFLLGIQAVFLAMAPGAHGCVMAGLQGRGCPHLERAVLSWPLGNYSPKAVPDSSPVTFCPLDCLLPSLIAISPRLCLESIFQVHV